MVPIFKDGDKQNVKNYRGVVLLDCVSKVLERLIFEKLYPRVESLLSDDQHGFRKGRSTTAQMICYLNEVFENINQPTLLSLYLDFEKAFDKVCHEKLLEKLLILGFGGPLLALLESYLSNRSQRVRIGNSYSRYLETSSGVPQGSVLGPFFFILFINDLPSQLMSKSFGYADDFKIISQNAVTLQIDGHRLWKSCSENQMSLNLKKCNVVAFKGTASVALGGHILNTAAVQKDLGIQVSESLSWACHVENRTTKALKCFYMIKRSTLNTTAWQTKKAIYRSYIVPIVSYGAILFKARKTDLRIIENVQKRAVKWIFNRKDNDYKTSLQILNLLPLSLYHELHVLLTFISIVKNKIDVEWRNYVSVGEQQITRAGQITQYKCKVYKLQKQESDFWYRAAHLANLFGRYLSGDVCETPNIKGKLSDVYSLYFDQKYDFNNVCTWRIFCNCSDCRDLNKLNL